MAEEGKEHSIQEEKGEDMRAEEKEDTRKPWGMLLPKCDSIPHTSLIDPEFTLGRSNRCNLRLSHPHISGVHFKISLQQIKNVKVVSIVDHSSNGTFVNQVRLEKGKTFLLKHNNTISLVHAKSKKWSFSFIDLSVIDRERKDHETILERYDLHETMGQGTFSTVKRCVCKETGDEFAIKIIDKSRFFHIDKTREQIKREVDILKQIKHPYIISIHDVIETDRWLYIVLELATGGDLFRSLESRAKFSETDAKRIFKQILEGLKYLHNEKATAHRDLKPENILLADKTENSDIKITDFGLARMTTHHGRTMTTMCGTPEYVAPEILFSSTNSTKEADGYGVEVDMWSVGALLYILLSGTLAFHAPTKVLLYHAIRKGKFSFPEERWKNVSDSAKDLITKLIVVDAKKRLTVNEALCHPWISGDSEKQSSPLEIQDALKFTMSQGSLSYNVLDFEEVEVEVREEDSANRTPRNLDAVSSPDINEVEQNGNEQLSSLLEKRSLSDDTNIPSPKRPKTK